MRGAKRRFVPGLFCLEPRVVLSRLGGTNLAPVLHLRETTPIKTPDRPVVMVDHLTNPGSAPATEVAAQRRGPERDANSFVENGRSQAHKKIQPTKPSHPPGAVIDARETHAHVSFTEPYNGQQVFTFINQGARSRRTS